MPHVSRTARTLGLITLMLVAVPTLDAQRAPKKGPREPDRADLRAQATLEFFGGRATPEYLDFKARLAERELKAWEHLVPGTEAFRAARPAAAMSGIPANAWTNIGPLRGQGQLYITDTNIADTGRPTVILPHPTNKDLIYVGYAGGGLWRCSNADVTASGDWVWTPLTDALPGGSPAGNLSIGGAAFKPEDANTLYLALGDMQPGSADATAEGRGFFISTDGGDNWTRGGTLGNTTRVKTVLALSGNLVLVAGNGGLWRSTNGGSSFTQVVSGPIGSSTTCWDLIRLANGDLLQAYQGGVAYSTDNGASWTAATYDSTITTAGMRRIALAANGATVYGLFQNSAGGFPKAIMKSTNSGRTWTYQAGTGLFNASGDGEQAGYNHLIAVDPTDANKVFAGTNLSLYRSGNGGADWERMSQWMGYDRHYIHADFHVHAWMQAAGGPKTLFLGTDGGLAVVRNPDIQPIPTGSGGVPSDVTFIDNRRNRNIATQLIYHVGSTTASTPAGARDRVIIGLQDQGTRLRTESSVGTQAYDLVLGGDGFGCLIHPYDGNKMLGSLYFSRVYRSTDGGANFTQGTGITGAGNSAVGPFFTRMAQDLSDPTGERVYTYTNSLPYVSTNFGSTWTAMPTTGITAGATIRNITASPLTPNHLGLALSGGRVALTTDGSTWTTVASSAFPNNGSFMSGVAFDTENPNILYAHSVAFNAATSHIWKSVNGGAAWTAVDVSNGFPFGIPVHMVKVDPLDRNTVYAGTDLGIYRSEDAGGTWSRFGSGLPLVSVRDIYIAPDGTFMRIGTHGRGVWEMQGVSTNYAPKITAQPQSRTVLAGEAALFGVVAAGLPAPTYTWQVSTDGSTWNTAPGAATGMAYSTGATQVTDSGKRYRVLVTNSVGTTTSSTATLTVQAGTAPTITTHPSSVTQTAGLRVDLSGAATGAPAPTYQWQSSPNGTTWSNVSGATSATYRFYPPLSEAGKQFRFQAINGSGTVASNPATLTLTPYLEQKLVNPDWEVTPWGTGWVFSHGNMYSTQHTREGGFALYLGDWDGVTTDHARQDVVLPANPKAVTVSFWLKIVDRSAGTSSVVNTMTAKLQDSSGNDLATLATFNNTSTGYGSYAKVGPIDIKAHAGKTVRVLLTSSQPEAAKATAFYVDDVHVLVDTTPQGASLDANADGKVDAYDLLELLKRFGSTNAADLAKADFDGNGVINDADLTALLAAL